MIEDLIEVDRFALKGKKLIVIGHTDKYCNIEIVQDYKTGKILSETVFSYDIILKNSRYLAKIKERFFNKAWKKAKPLELKTENIIK